MRKVWTSGILPQRREGRLRREIPKIRQNTKYYCLANSCSQKLMMIVNDNDRFVPREDILAPRGQLTLVTPFSWRLFRL